MADMRQMRAQLMRAPVTAFSDSQSFCAALSTTVIGDGVGRVLFAVARDAHSIRVEPAPCENVECAPVRLRTPGTSAQ